jgi:hypothetical protein
MRVLVHYIPPENTPVGVWYLLHHQTLPKAFYIEPRHYRHGALNVFGDEGGQVFTLAHWNAKVTSLTESTSPLASWQEHETIKKPQDFLASLL